MYYVLDRIRRQPERDRDLPGRTAARSQVANVLNVCLGERIASRVPGLLQRRCPANVTRLVIAVVVLAIERMLRCRTRTHVLQKCGEIIPACADFDAAATVVLEVVAAGIATALTHSLPESEQRMAVLVRHCQSVLEVVLRHPFRLDVPKQAST